MPSAACPQWCLNRLARSCVIHRPSADYGAACGAPLGLIPLGMNEPPECLLTSPHKGYRHYAVHPDHPDRFWMWDDETTVLPPAQGDGS